MTEQQTVTVNGYEEEARGWAVYDEDKDHYVAVYACTHEDWSNDAEAHDEAPSLEHAESLVSGGSADDGGFFLGSKEEIVATIRHHRHTATDRLLRNMLALLDSVVAGRQLRTPMTVEEQEARDALLGDYEKVRGQLAATFAHPLDTHADVRAFLILTEGWEA